MPRRVHQAEVELCEGHALIGRPTEPFRGVNLVFLDPKPGSIACAGVVLCERIASLGSLFEPGHRRRVVPRNTFALCVESAQAILSFGVALIGERAPKLGGLGEVSLMVRIDPLLQRTLGVGVEHGGEETCRDKMLCVEVHGILVFNARRRLAKPDTLPQSRIPILAIVRFQSSCVTPPVSGIMFSSAQREVLSLPTWLTGPVGSPG